MPSFNANVLPASTGFDLGSPAQSWDLFAQQINWGDGSTSDVLLQRVAANTLGLAAGDSFALDSLVLDGTNRDVTLVRSAADTLRLATGDKFIPQTTGQDLGATGNRWDVFGQTADWSSGTTASAFVHANTGPSSWVSRSLSVWHDAERHIINSLPQSVQHGAMTVNALVGGIEIPSDATMASGAGSAAAIAGYARSASSGATAIGGVGVYGQATVNAATVSAWGANFGARNTPEQSDLDNAGLAVAALYACELNISMKKLAGGATPTGPARGLFIIGGSSEQTTSNIFRAIDIEPAGVFESPKIKWKHGLHVADEAADVGIEVGATGSGNSVGSMPIKLKGRDSGGTQLAPDLLADSFGNLVFRTSAGAQILSLRNDQKVSIQSGMQVDSAGFKHTRIASGTTAGSLHDIASATWTFTTAFADTNYTITCVVDNPTGVPIVAYTDNKAAGSIDIVIIAGSAAAASGTLDCIAVHD